MARMTDLIRETICEFFYEKGIDIYGEDVDELLDAIKACFEYASYSVATPSVNMEIKKLRRDLEIERSKVPCPACKGSGVEVSYGPAHSAHSSCPTCKGEGKTLP